MPHFPGWRLIGSFPDGDPDGVGSWLLHHNGEAALLEVPPGLEVGHVEAALDAVGASLVYGLASHDHEDHLDYDTWRRLIDSFQEAEFMHPATVRWSRRLRLGLPVEPLWLLGAPKHSISDVVTVFRGVAMTGDIELGTLGSVNDEVPKSIRSQSMSWLREFESRCGYHVNSIVSAHLNDVRCCVNWRDLFTA